VGVNRGSKKGGGLKVTAKQWAHRLYQTFLAKQLWQKRLMLLRTNINEATAKSANALAGP
jgi:hypothetical protein